MKWTQEEIKLLIAEYPSTRTDELAKKLNRSYTSTAQMARRLGLRKTKEFLSKMRSEISPQRKRTMERYEQLKRELQSEVRAYLAGLFDGEGSVTVYEQTDKYRVRKHGLEASISNTHKETLEWIKNIIGFGSVYKTNKVRKQCYEYFISDWQAVAFLELIAPYLRIKKEKALKCVETYKTQRMSTGGDCIKSLVGEIICQSGA